MINSILPYYGAKREQAATIIAALDSHAVYWEPFCGSLSILLAKPKSRVEVVNDLHGGVINLAMVVQDDWLGPTLFEKLQRTVFDEATFNRSKEWLETWHPNSAKLEELNLGFAYHYFVFSWQARNGFAGTEKELSLKLAKRFTSNGGDPAVRFKNAVDSIPAWWERLRGVTILSEDGIKLCEKIEDKQGTAIYIDPPYFAKSVDYAIDFAHHQHEELAISL